MIRFGIIGTNWITDEFIGAALQHPEFQLNAVYSRAKEKGDAFASKYGVTNVYTSLEEMADSGNIDAVYIASPNILHCEQSLIFLKRKICVLCEKPMATNEIEAIKMIEASKEYNTLLMESFRSLHEPRFLAAEQNLHKLGVIRHIVASKCQYSSKYNNYLAGVIANAFKPEFGNGAMMDIGIYLIRPMVHFFGKPKKILSSAYMLETGVDGSGSLIASYDTMQVNLNFSKVSSSHSPIEVLGEKGTMYISRRWDKPYLKIRYVDDTEEYIDVVQNKEGLYYPLETFINLIKSGDLESPNDKFQDIIYALQTTDEYRKQIGLRFPSDEK